jgi:hypothetical protein
MRILYTLFCALMACTSLHGQDSAAWAKARSNAEEAMRKQTALEFEFRSGLIRLGLADANVMTTSHYASVNAGYGNKYRSGTEKIAKAEALLGLEFYAAEGSTYFESRASDANGSSEYRVELRDYPDVSALTSAADAALNELKRHKK